MHFPLNSKLTWLPDDGREKNFFSTLFTVDKSPGARQRLFDFLALTQIVSFLTKPLAPPLRHGLYYFLCKFQTDTNLLTYCVIIIPMVTWWNASIFQPLQDNYKIMTKCRSSISLSKEAVSQLASNSLDKERYLYPYLIPCQTLYLHIPVSSLSQADADTCIKVRIGIFSSVYAFSQADTLCMINDKKYDLWQSKRTAAIGFVTSPIVCV